MPTRSFRWLVVAACLSVVGLISGTVFLAATSDDSSLLRVGFDDDTAQEDTFEDGFDDDGEREDEPFDYGDDEDLDFLYDECDAGDLEACDELYYESPSNSAYEDFGSTCGDREDDLYGECAAELGGELDEEESGEDPELDLGDLRDACAAGDMEACDELYFDSPVGSDEEEFGSTCGGRQDETNGDCA